MADYYTLKKIAVRLGYRNCLTVYSLIKNKAFPAYQKYNRKWYTNDDLIRTWELEQAKICRQRLISRSKTLAHHLTTKPKPKTDPNLTNSRSMLKEVS